MKAGLKEGEAPWLGAFGAFVAVAPIVCICPWIGAHGSWSSLQSEGPTLAPKSCASATNVNHQ